MLGKTAGGLFWLARNLERGESNARLVDAGFRIALTRTTAADEEWTSILATAAVQHRFNESYESGDAFNAINFLLRDRNNSSSVLSCIKAARDNARLVRTALTREVWEAINVCWMTLKSALARPVTPAELPNVLTTIRHQCAIVRGAIHGTMLRNDIFSFLRTGTFIERGDNTARILDVKYYVLLPAAASVGSSLDNVQWESILRSTSADRAFAWLYGGEVSPAQIAAFLILDSRMPRSLAFCANNLVEHLGRLRDQYNEPQFCTELAAAQRDRLHNQTIEAIFNAGLHEFILNFIRENTALAASIETDYRFYA
jgi:uncharacterized alpha-E superfamily protein